MFYKLENVIDYLKKIAEMSPLQNRHSACIVNKNKIIACGINRYIKESNLIKNHNNYNITKEINVKFAIHAEMDAVRHVIKKGYDIVIIRINKSYQLLNSRPCNACIDKMRSKGIRKVYYSNSNGNMSCEFVDEMQKKHTSSGLKIRHCFN